MTQGDMNWELASLADYNGDGETDIIWRNKTTGQNFVWYLDGENMIGCGYILGQGDMDWELIGK